MGLPEPGDPHGTLRGHALVRFVAGGLQEPDELCPGHRVGLIDAVVVCVETGGWCLVVLIIVDVAYCRRVGLYCCCWLLISIVQLCGGQESAVIFVGVRFAFFC